MVVTRLEILQYVLTILDIEKEGQKLLIDQGIDYVRNIIHTNHETHQSLVNKEQYMLFIVYIYQLFIFK